VKDKLPGITEKQFEAQVKDLAKIFHAEKYYHPFLSKWSERGYPDATIIKVPKLIFLEYKSEKGKPTEAQVEWIDLLNQCTSVEAHICYPKDLEQIAELLRGV